MYRKSAETFIKMRRMEPYQTFGYVTWGDGTESEFPLKLSMDEVEDLVKYPTPFDYLCAKALDLYTNRREDEIRSIFVGYKIREAKPWKEE